MYLIIFRHANNQPSCGRQGFGIQKQRALDRATGDWVLSVDADERIPDKLGEEIEAAIGEPRYAGYQINRLKAPLSAH